MIYNADMFDILPTLPEKSIDCCIIDPPYGTTPLEWDKLIDFEKLWYELKRVCKDTCPILIFGQEPFSSYVRLSNIDIYKYDWYWQKERLTNVFQVKKRPGKVIETISIFYKEQCPYYPIKEKHLGKKVTNKIKGNFSDTLAGKNTTYKPAEYKDDGTRYPNQVIYCNRDSIRDNVHETQKPLEVIRYIIQTYTKKGDLVLDPCMGSGTTIIVCNQEERKSIGIEKYCFDVAKKRIEESKVITTEDRKKIEGLF